MNEYHQPDSPAWTNATTVSADRAVRPTGNRPWSRVLNVDVSQNSATLDDVLASHRLLRPLYLWCFRLTFRLWSRLSVKGVENLPASGPYVLAVNHESHLDSMFVTCVLPGAVQQRMVVVSKKEHFDNPMTRFFARLCHAVPVDRALDSASILALCTLVLKRGNVLFIHPEGTRSPDGRLQPFKKGVAVVAHDAGCPVVPVRITGAFRFWPKQARLPRRRSRITVTVGQPIPPPRADRPDTDAFTENIRASVAALGARYGKGTDAAPRS